MTNFTRRGLVLVAVIFLHGCASSNTAPNPRLSDGERRILGAIQMASEEGGYGAARNGIKNYPSVVANAIHHGDKDPAALAPIFIASLRTDAASAEMQAGILATVLLYVGDAPFAAALNTAPPAARQMSLLLLSHALRKEGSSYELYLDPAKFPRTTALVGSRTP